MFRQVQQEWKIQVTYNITGLCGTVRKVQSAQTSLSSSFVCLIDLVLQVWIKPNGEMPFLYGNHVVKAHLGRITEDTPEHQGVVVFSMHDVPLVSNNFIATLRKIDLFARASV